MRIPAVLGGVFVAAAVIILAALIWIPPPLSTAPAREPGQSFNLTPPLSGWSDRRIVRQQGEPALVFARRATMNVFEATYHCGENQYQQSLGATIYGLTAQRSVPRPQNLGDMKAGDLIEALGLQPASVMRCGFCSQRAFVLAEALHRAGIPAQVLALNGHVVTRLDIGGTPYVADADYGVTPFQYTAATEDMSVRVARAYRDVIPDPGQARTIFAAYQNTGDDAVYFSDLSYLEKVSNDQETMIGWINASLLALALTLGGGGILLLLNSKSIVTLRTSLSGRSPASEDR